MAIQRSFDVVNNNSSDDDGHPPRTGTLWSCVAHIIAAVIGSGVLSLAWSISHLGWIGGPIILLCFAIVTYISSYLLSDCYRYPDSVTGIRNCSYMDAVRKNLANGVIKGSIYGVPASNVANKIWFTFQASADIAFAYPYSIVLLEIQDTLKSPPPENQTMKNASIIAIFITTFFYLCCGCFGYAAFGNKTPGNLLTGFGFYEPYWLVDLANACIVLHLVGGYQIYSQPVFAVVERWFSIKFPAKLYTIKIPLLPRFQVNAFRICFRTVYVASTTGIAIIFPYFNQVLGVLGALGFWPLTIYFPVEMYFVQKKIQVWSRRWIILRSFSFVCFLVTVVGLIGSLEGLVSAKLS